MLGTSNYVNYSRRNLKRSRKYIHHTGTLGSSFERAGTFCVKEERKIRNSSILRWTYQSRSTSSRKGRPHGHRYLVKKPGDKEYHTANQLKKRCNKEFFQGIHDRFIRDPEFRNRMIENHRDEELCRKWDALADEDHTHHWTHKNTLSIRVIGGFIRTSKVPTLCQWRTDLVSNRHCLPCHNWNKKAEGASQAPTYSHRNQKWAQSSSSWWN